ncbi:MAG: hypothetical protein OHK0040_12760 [bacterium]
MPELSYEDVKKVILKLYEMGARILIIEGGEPFMWTDRAEKKDIKDVVQFSKRYFFSVGVTTNGTFPIKDFPADVCWVSFDGMEETYKKIRGDVFNKVVENIKQSNHKNLYANVTINKINEKELSDIVKFLSPIVKGITIQFHYPYGVEGDDNLFIPLREREEIINRLILLKKEGYKIADSYGCLEDMKKNEWLCHDWMLVNADPDGKITMGCYLKNRGDVDCKSCGFAAHVEISKAFDLHLPSILVGKKIFSYRMVNN